MKKNWLKYLISSIISLSVFSATLVSFSFGSQNQLSLLKDDLINYASSIEERLYFSIDNAPNKISSLLNSSALYNLENRYRTYALATRMFTENFYFSISYDDLILEKDINLLESKESPRDNQDFIYLGNLPILDGERLDLDNDNYYSRYSFLSSSDDAIYIPEDFANEICEQFNLDGYKDIIFSDDVNSGYLSKIKVELKNVLDDEFSYECKLRGVYSNESQLANELKHIPNNQNIPNIICSPALFDNIDWAMDTLLCVFKPPLSAIYVENYGRFLNVLESASQNKKININFDCNLNEEIANYFNSRVETINNYFFFNYQWICYLIGAILALSYLGVIIFYLRKFKTNFYINIAILVGTFLISFIVLHFINFPNIIIPSNSSLYWTILCLAFYLIPLFLLCYRKSKPEKNQLQNLYEEIYI